ncbi:MAG TPA: hypothetical protein VM925_28410 [Labilithrix sp.]|nr:hypothetical protein [Labilithrix sp.]
MKPVVLIDQERVKTCRQSVENVCRVCKTPDRCSTCYVDGIKTILAEQEKRRSSTYRIRLRLVNNHPDVDTVPLRGVASRAMMNCVGCSHRTEEICQDCDVSRIDELVQLAIEKRIRPSGAHR